MRRISSSLPTAILLCLLAVPCLTTPVLAAKPAEQSDKIPSDALSELLGDAKQDYIAESTLKTNPNAGGTYDYRDVTTLPVFERYSSKDRWQGNSATTLLESLQNFHGTRGSSALRVIWRHILLSDYEGLKIDGKDKNGQQIALFSERLKLLNGLGYFDEAVRLYQAADTQKNPIPESVVRQGVDAMALSGSADGACLEVNLALGSLRNDEWLQNGALCAAYFGQSKKADALYKLVKDEAGSGFRATYKLLQQKNVNTIVQVDIPPLWRTLLLAKGASVGVNSLSSISPADLSAIAINKNVPYGLRLNAGMRAAQAGTVSVDQLRKLYDEQGKPSDAELASILAAVKRGDTISRAKMYQAARFTFSGQDRATIVDKALKSLPNVNSTLGEVYHWIVVKLTLQKDAIAWFAPTGYVTLRVGNRGDAKYYYQYGKLDGHYTSFIALFDNIDKATPEFFNKWRKDIKKRFPTDALWRIDTAMAIAHMIGVSDTVTGSTVTGSPSASQKANQKDTSPLLPSTVTRKQLQPFDKAVENNERGNAVVAALGLFAEAPWRRLQPSYLTYLMNGLKKVGAKGENHKIGLEIAMQTVI
jgi:hypothetical protein